MQQRRQSHEVDYIIHGSEIQFVEIELDPNETAIAEAGAMMYMEQGIQMDSRLGDGSKKNSGMLGSVLGVGKRAIVGESLWVTFFTNKGQGKKRVAFTAPYPGMIIPLDLGKLGGSVLCQKESFVCGAKGVSIGVGITKRLGAAFFGGEGFILQKLQGDGLAFIHSGGSVMEKDLAPGEILYVDTGSIIAFQPSVDFNIHTIRGVKSILFAGENFFLSSLKGPGKVWLQSMPYQRFLMHLATSLFGNKKRKSKRH